MRTRANADVVLTIGLTVGGLQGIDFRNSKLEMCDKCLDICCKSNHDMFSIIKKGCQERK